MPRETRMAAPVKCNAWFGLLRLRLVAGKFADDFAYPLMIEDYRNAARCQEKRHSVLYRQRVGVIHFMPVPAVRYDRKRPERRPVLECADRLGECVAVHCCSLHLLDRIAQLTSYHLVSVPVTLLTPKPARSGAAFC